MTDRCKDCGALLALVGIRHRCNGRPKAAEPTKAERRQQRREFLAKAAGKPVNVFSVIAVDQKPAGKAGRPKAVPKKPLKFNPIGSGRTPKASEKFTLKATKPWKAAGISRATYFRRQAEKAK